MNGASRKKNLIDLVVVIIVGFAYLFIEKPGDEIRKQEAWERSLYLSQPAEVLTPSDADHDYAQPKPQ